jgi:hypothetical protein
MSGEPFFHLASFLIVAISPAIRINFRARADRQGGRLQDPAGERWKFQVGGAFRMLIVSAGLPRGRLILLGVFDVQFLLFRQEERYETYPMAES